MIEKKYVSMGKERVRERIEAGLLTVDGKTWTWDDGELLRVFKYLGYDRRSKSYRLRVVHQERRVTDGDL